MKMFRIFIFLLLIGGAIGVSLVLINEQVQPPFSRSLSPLFQELGKPIKSIDRAISQILPVGDIDEKMLGDEIKLRFSQTSKPTTPDEEITVRYLNSLINSLSNESSKPFNYTVFLVDGSPNAFAMPGGALCVTKGLMDVLTNEAELVAILSHEIGHVERGHLFDAARGEMLRRKIKKASTITYASDVIHSIISLNFSKTQENEADEYGFRLLLKKGYDPIAMSTSFQKLMIEHTENIQGPTNPFNDFFATHPYTELRIEKFRSQAKLWKEHHPSEVRHLGENNFKNRITFFETSNAKEVNTP
jgi:beta-barrel assembly-enhancing protease